MKKICLFLILFAFSFQLFAEESSVETYHPHLKVGISLIVAGAAVMAGGITGFHIAADKERDKYSKMRKLAFMQDDEEKEDEYFDKAYKHRDKANTYTSLEAVAGVIGGELILTGIILAAIKAEKTDDVSITNISVSPSKEGFYASLGFEF